MNININEVNGNMARKICKSIMVDKVEYKALFKLLKGNDVRFNEWVRTQIRNELKRHNALPESILLTPKQEKI